MEIITQRFVRPSLLIEEYQAEGNEAFFLDMERHHWSIAGFTVDKHPNEIAGKYDQLKLLVPGGETWEFENANVQLAPIGKPFRHKSSQMNRYQYVVVFDNVHKWRLHE